MRRPHTAEEVRIAQQRAAVLQEIHNYIIDYGLKNQMTCEELATLIAGLMIRTTGNPVDLGSALGSVTSKLIEFTTHHLANVKAEGSA